jgi:histidinol-phosphate aminotransferase
VGELSSRKSVFKRNTNSAILQLEPYVAGPTREEIRKSADVPNAEIVKLSSNENPLGPSPKAIEAVRNMAGQISLYPSAKCAKLRDAIARNLRLGLTSGNVLVAAGSSEIFSFIIRAFSKPSDQIVYAYPSFSVYSDASIVDGRIPVRAPLEPPLFDIRADLIKQYMNERTRVIFITRPNNPTSRLVPLTEVRAICEGARNSVIVCDEAYVEFAEAYPSVSAVNLLNETDNLLVTRTFSKAYGLSDLRVGYVIGPTEAIDVLFKIRPKWNTGELVQTAAIAALNDTQHFADTLQLVHEGRKFFMNELTQMGFEVTPEPQGNFVFASPSRIGLQAELILKALLDKGIAVRGPPTDWKLNYLRISVGTRAQNERFVRSINTLLN